MSISASLAAKVVGGTSVGLACTASTYYAVKHFSKVALNEVEQKIHDTDEINLEAKAPTKDSNNDVSLEITVASSSKTQLEEGKSWKCTVESSLEASEVALFDSSKEELKKTIENNRKQDKGGCYK